MEVPKYSLDRTPEQMREDALMWARAGYPSVAVGRYRDAADQIERLSAYTDKLVSQFPEGCLPKDVEVLREANVLLAQEVQQLRMALEERPEVF